MKSLGVFLLIASTINILWFPITDAVHGVLHSLQSSLHSHHHTHSHQTHTHHADSHHHHYSSHAVEEHGTVKNLLNAFAPADEQKQSFVTVILFLFFSAHVVYFFLSPFAGKISLIFEDKKYALHIAPLTPPPLV